MLLLLIAASLLLVHPFTPRDPRSWTALAYSAKAIGFATAFVVGSNTCAVNTWCAASRTSWDAALTLASAAELALRCAVGFTALFAANFSATSVAASVEAQVKTLLPSKPCMPPIARNLFVFGVNGMVISLAVPALLTAAGL